MITGASGFIGATLVTEALNRGHSVHAMIRPATDVASLLWSADSRVTIVRHDLRSSRQMAEKIGGVDAVIHAAAVKSGDFYSQFAGTVVATEHLLNAMREASIEHIICISSFAVYDYLHRRGGSVLDENSPVEQSPAGRYPYCETKLKQEELVRDFAEQHGWRWTILRPGAVYGLRNLWTGRLGFDGPKYWLRLGAWARVPLTYVENCAEAILLALEKKEAHGQVFNVVDDHPPTQRQYMKELRARINPRARVVPVPWPLLRAAARMIWIVNRGVFRGRAKVPNLLVPANLHAVFKPLRYPNQHLKTVLGWTCRFSRDEALDHVLNSAKSDTNAA